MERFQVVTMEDVVGEIDMFTSATGDFNIIALEHMKNDNASRYSEERACRS